jgi:hypothetical protein
MLVEILDFYKRAVPRGDPFTRTVSWTSGSTPSLEIDTEGEEATPTDWEILIDKIIVVASNNFALDGADKISISGWEATAIEISSLEELISMCENVSTFKVSADFDRVHGVVAPKPPVRLQEAGEDAEKVLTISNSGGDTATITGSLSITVQGWKLPAADY